MVDIRKNQVGKETMSIGKEEQNRLVDLAYLGRDNAEEEGAGDLDRAIVDLAYHVLQYQTSANRQSKWNLIDASLSVVRLLKKEETK